MLRQRDPDLLLVEAMLAPPPLDEARSSLDYWRRRGSALPLYRRAARREAKEMAARWEARVRAAELARFEASVAGRVLAALGIRLHWLRQVRIEKRALLVLGWALVPRTVKLYAAGLVAVSLLFVTALAVVFAQLA